MNPDDENAEDPTTPDEQEQTTPVVAPLPQATGSMTVENKKALWRAIRETGASRDSATAYVNHVEQSGMSKHDAYTKAGLAVPPKAGAPVAPAAVAPSGNSQVNPSSLLMAMGDHFQDGATFGYGNKAIAALSSLARSGDMSDYKDNLAANMADLENETKAHPVLARMAGGAGMIVSPINKIAGAVGGGLKGAAAIGALAGEGASHDTSLQQSAIDTGVGAGMGGVIGTAVDHLAPLIPGVKALPGAVSRLIQKLGVSKSAAEAPLIPSVAERMTARSVLDPKADVDGAINMMDQNGRGDVATLGDLSKKNRALRDVAANKSPDAADETATVLEGRNADANGRVAADLQTAAGGNPVADRIIQGYKDSKAAWASKAYGSLSKQNAEVDPEQFYGALDGFLKQPKVADAWNYAKSVGLIGDPPDAAALALKEHAGKLAQAKADQAAAAEAQANGPKSVYDQLIATGATPEALARKGIVQDAAPAVPPLPEKPGPSFEMVQTTKERLDDAITKAKAAGMGNEMRRLIQVRDSFKDFLTEHVAGWADVNREYQARSELERQVQSGADAFNESVMGNVNDSYAHAVANGPAAVDAWRKGLLSQAVAKVQNVKGNVANGGAADFVNASPNLEQKLKLGFGSQQKFKTFMDRMVSEQELAKGNSALTGSATARRLQGTEAGANSTAINVANGHTAGAAAEGKGGSYLNAMITHLVKPLLKKQGMTQGVAREVASSLNTQGTPAMRAAVAQMRTLPDALLPTIGRKAVPVGVHGLASLILGQPH